MYILRIIYTSLVLELCAGFFQPAHVKNVRIADAASVSIPKNDGITLFGARNSAVYKEKGWKCLLASTVILSNTYLFGFDVPAGRADGYSASELFAKAENAIEKTSGDFKLLLNEWGEAKKVLDDCNKIVVSTDELVKSVSKDLGIIETKVTKIVEDIEGIKTVVSKDIEELSAVTAAKFDAAEASSSAGVNPAIVAKKFLEAENEAKVLAKENKLLAELTETSKGGSAVLSVARESVSNGASVLEKLNKVASLQSEAQIILTQGIDNSIKSCRDQLTECSSKGKEGVQQFKSGVSVLRKAADKFSNVVRDVESDQR